VFSGQRLSLQLVRPARLLFRIDDGLNNGRLGRAESRQDCRSNLLGCCATKTLFPTGLGISNEVDWRQVAAEDSEASPRRSNTPKPARAARTRLRRAGCY
jgi:hypothetical protein